MTRQKKRPIDWWDELWYDIPGYEWIYEINKLGQIRSYWKNNNKENRVDHEPQRLIQPWRKPHKLTGCKAEVTLFNWLKRKHFYVWRLVAQVFMWLDPKDKTKQIIHKNWNNMDCRKSNLYIWSVSERAFNYHNPWVLFSNRYVKWKKN